MKLTMHSVMLLVLLLRQAAAVFEHVTTADVDLKELRCLVCQDVVTEIAEVVKKADPSTKMAVGEFRIDSDGNIPQKLVPYARSERHLSDVMDQVCDVMDDYVRAIDRETGRLRTLKLTSVGVMNPEISKVQVVTDSDLNKSLKHYCLGIVEEFEEEVLRHFSSKSVPGEEQELDFCTARTGLCPVMRPRPRVEL